MIQPLDTVSGAPLAAGRWGKDRSLEEQRPAVLAVPALPALLALLGALAFIAGCQTAPAPKPKPQAYPAPAFAENWFALLPVPKPDVAERIYLSETQHLIFVYTQQNRAYVLDTSGRVLFGEQITRPGTPLRAPIATADRIIFPTADALLLFDRSGNQVDKINLGHSTRGSGAYQNDVIYVGLDYTTGERLTAIDLTRRFAPITWQVMVGGALSGTPVVFDSVIFAGDESGRVCAVDDQGKAVWPDPGYVQTGGVYCDLAADEQGVYVASHDTKLYCLDRTTGLIKWTYYASRPLSQSPVAHKNTVYQVVPEIGLAAIDKASARGNVLPKWIARGITQWISEDANYVYAADASSRIVALDKATGKPKFQSTAAHFAAFGINQDDATIYAVTASGRFSSARAELRPGWIGTLVKAPDSGAYGAPDRLLSDSLGRDREPANGTALAAAR